jgi:hypothetical protein
MTFSPEIDQTITYKLVNTHKRRAHIRAILLRAKGSWAEDKESAGIAGDIAKQAPSVEEMRTLSV